MNLKKLFTGTVLAAGLAGVSQQEAKAIPYQLNLAGTENASLVINFETGGVIDLAAHPDALISDNAITGGILTVGSDTWNYSSGRVTALNNLGGDSLTLNFMGSDSTVQFLFNDLSGTAWSSLDLQAVLDSMNGKDGSLDIVLPQGEIHSIITSAEAGPTGAVGVPDGGSTLVLGAIGAAAIAGYAGVTRKKKEEPAFTPSGPA